MTQPLFESNAIPVLDDVRDIFTQRGIQYSDTWRYGKWSAVKQTLKFIGVGKFVNDEELRTIVAASLVDVKIARMEGAYKEDTAIDLIAYLGNWVGQMRRLQDIKETQEADDNFFPGD